MFFTLVHKRYIINVCKYLYLYTQLKGSRNGNIIIILINENKSLL